MVIKTLNIQNPFSDYGEIVKEKRFVGRKDEIKAIHNRVLGLNYGNIAIMGLPRIGKTCLAWNALIPIKGELAKDGNFVSLVYVGKVTSSTEFFKQLIYQTIEEIELFGDNELSALLVIFKSIQKEIKLSENDRFDFNNLVCKFFKILKRNKLRATYILDEFDSVEKIFSVSDYQTLRQLASQPETQICLITVSRRTIQELEPENGAISNFFGIFSDLRLGVFKKDDLIEYWGVVRQYDIDVSEEYKNIVYYLVGGHPFLLDLYNYEYFNRLKNYYFVSINSIAYNIESEIKLSLFNNFENILNLLKEEGLYSKAIQLILGPVYDVTAIDEQKLLKYEFIKIVDSFEKLNILKQDVGVKNQRNNSAYICFSVFFTELLNLKYSDIDYWPLWSQTEKAIRLLIKEYLFKVFGADWEPGYKLKIENSDGKKKTIKKLDEIRASTINKFGNLASTHLVDYTFPRDMYNLFISSDWSWFKNIFKETQGDWSKRFCSLAEIRNPIAHNNSEFVSAEELRNVKKYCEIIMTRINQWKDADVPSMLSP